MALSLVGTDFRRFAGPEGVFTVGNRRKVQDGGPRLESSGRHAADDQRWDPAPRSGSLLWHPRPFPARSETGRGRRTNHSQYSSLLPKYDFANTSDPSGATSVSKMFGPLWYRIGFASSSLSPKYKGHIRSLMYRLFDKAMLWELLNVERNPMDLVEVKGISKAQENVLASFR